MVRKKIVIEMDSEIEDLTFEDNVLFALHEEMFQAIAHRNNIDIRRAKSEYILKPGTAEDWDGMAESEYWYDWSSDGDQHQFNMQPIQNFECVGVYGWLNGNLDNTINHLEIWINNEKVREYPGYLLYSFQNKKYLVSDAINQSRIDDLLSNEKISNKLCIFKEPVYAMSTQTLQIFPNTTNASVVSKAFPLFWIIKKR